LRTDLHDRLAHRALAYGLAGIVALGLGLRHLIHDGQIADSLSAGAGTAVLLAMFTFGRGVTELAQRSDTKRLQEAISGAFGSDGPLHWVGEDHLATSLPVG
jgi:hypothetical protein